MSLDWIDVQTHACKLLNATERVIFLTPSELINAKAMVDRAQKDGYTVVTIPETVKEKIRGLTDAAGNPLRDLGTYTTEWNESFEFKFVKEKDLTKPEREIFKKTPAIFALIGGKPICRFPDKPLYRPVTGSKRTQNHSDAPSPKEPCLGAQPASASGTSERSIRFSEKQQGRFVRPAANEGRTHGLERRDA